MGTILSFTQTLPAIFQDHEFVVFNSFLDILLLFYRFVLNLNNYLFEFNFLIETHLYDEPFVVLNKHFVQGLKNEILNLFIGVEYGDVGFQSFVVLLL